MTTEVYRSFTPKNSSTQAKKSRKKLEGTSENLNLKTRLHIFFFKNWIFYGEQIYLQFINIFKFQKYYQFTNFEYFYQKCLEVFKCTSLVNLNDNLNITSNVISTTKLFIYALFQSEDTGFDMRHRIKCTTNNVFSTANVFVSVWICHNQNKDVIKTRDESNEMFRPINLKASWKGTEIVCDWSQKFTDFPNLPSEWNNRGFVQIRILGTKQKHNYQF